MDTAEFWIKALELQKHPEGGWFKEVYRSEGVIPFNGQSSEFNGDRNYSTSIYYLLEGTDFSAFHKIKSDELWHFYEGNSPVEIVQIDKNIEKERLGRAIQSNEHFQIVIPKNIWFAAHLLNKNGFALLGCTVSPGFNFEDFELADKTLLKKYPELEKEIFPFLSDS
jgi:uncharacterized protein